MTDPRDRLLEHALYEEIGGDGADAPDLAPAIRAAWERTTAAPAERRPQMPKPARPLWLPLGAAAALAVIGGGAWWASTRPSTVPDAPTEKVAQGSPGGEGRATPKEGSAGSQPAAPALSAALVARAGVLGEALGDLVDPTLPPGMLLELIATYAREGPLAELRRTPALWPVAAPDVERLLQPGTLAAYGRTPLIEALALDGSREAERLVRAAWLVDPEAFSINAIVVMAERQAFEFEREATAWLGMLGDGVPGEPFELALYGALRGDGRGAAILEALLTEESKEPEVPLLAAVCLAKLGRGTAWIETWDAYRGSLRDQLAAPELDSNGIADAARRVDALAYAWSLHDGLPLEGIAPTAVWDGVPRAGSFRHWLDLYYAAQATRERTRESLADELATLEER